MLDKSVEDLGLKGSKEKKRINQYRDFSRSELIHVGFEKYGPYELIGIAPLTFHLNRNGQGVTLAFGGFDPNKVRDKHPAALYVRGVLLEIAGVLRYHAEEQKRKEQAKKALRK